MLRLVNLAVYPAQVLKVSPFPPKGWLPRALLVHHALGWLVGLHEHIPEFKNSNSEPATTSG